MREALEHERDRRYALTDTVRKNRNDRETKREKDRAEYAVAQLQVERDVRSFVEELRTARVEISRLRGEIALVRIQTDRLEHKRKSLMNSLERGGYLHRRKRARTDSTGGDAPRKT